MRTINLSQLPPTAPGTFLLYPNNERFLRGRSWRLHGKYEDRVVMLCLVLLVCALLAWMWTDWLNEWYRLTYQGRDTTAVVTGRDTRSGKSTSYYVLYRFELPGAAGVQQIDARELVRHATYEALTPGMRVRVRYVPDTPQLSSIEWTADPPVWTGVGLVVAVLGGCFSAAFMVDALKSLWLLRRVGQILPGRLIEARLLASRNGQRLSVTYRFTTPDQQVLSGEDDHLRNDLHGQPPRRGTPIAVLYVSPRVYQIL